MKRAERTYDQLLGLLRDTSPATSFTTEEIRSIIEEHAGERARFSPMPAPRRIALGTALLAAALTTVSLLRLTGPKPARPATVGIAMRSAAPIDTIPPSSEPMPGASGAERFTIATPSHGGRRPASTIAPPDRRPGQDDRNGSSGRSAISPSRSHEGSRDTAASRPSPPQNAPDIATPPDITTIPMLELTPEELKPLGVAFADGGIQTVCEEYYTLTTERERRTFAQMGIDTTQRSGIVRMQLSIDTADLTTTKHGWTRVDDYSRVAPVIALGSYVRDAHYNTVFVASFKHSPIMASARRSIDSMMTFLPVTLASSDIDKLMHDSDQVNPMRILVPVHIRLGDEPIIGSTKRRGTDIILWYYPTSEFAAALPARYRTSLQRELNVLADVVECNLPQREACRQLTGEPLLVNYCRRTSGALSGLNVSPNPAHDAFRLRYMLESGRTVVVSLYDIHGAYVRELVPATSIRSGLRSESVQLGDVRPGAYLVVLRSDQGEQVSERLIVQ